MKEKFEPYEKKISNSKTEKEDLPTDSDKILSDDFGSIYVSNEIFLELINRTTTPLKELSNNLPDKKSSST